MFAPEHKLVDGFIKNSDSDFAKSMTDFVNKVKTESEFDRNTKEKYGIFTGKFAIHPLTGERVPVWLGNYVLAGYAVSFWLFFVIPTFLNSAHAMAFFYYVPAMNPIGEDLRQMLSYSNSLFLNKSTPYIGQNLYPPLASVVFIPLLFVKFVDAYYFITLINFLCIILIAYIIPYLIGNKKISELSMFIFAISFFAYGVQFEIERGQFNLIAMSLCFVSIYLFYYHPKTRIFSYILFSLSIQLKIYPAIFILLFWDQEENWRNNMNRFVGLGVFNLVLFFSLGFNIFFDFFEAIKAQVSNPYIWVGNHSIESFAYLQKNNFTWLNDLFPVKFILLAVTIICILLIFITSFSRSEKINPFLLLGCTIGAAIIPSVSHDYKLAMLVMPIQVLLIQFHEGFEKKIWIIISNILAWFKLD